jgi:hypothetical protein
MQNKHVPRRELKEKVSNMSNLIAMAVCSVFQSLSLSLTNSPGTSVSLQSLPPALRVHFHANFSRPLGFRVTYMTRWLTVLFLSFVRSRPPGIMGV